jgi:hypothetical protein
VLTPLPRRRSKCWVSCFVFAATAQGRPAGILPEDLQTGRANANRFTRRLGADGPTAEEAWQVRQPISEGLRVAFGNMVDARRPAARAARGLPDDAVLTHYQQAAIDRDVIRDALLAYDLLEIVPYRQRGASVTASEHPLGVPATASSPEPIAPPEVVRSAAAIGGSAAAPHNAAFCPPAMLAPPVPAALAASVPEPNDTKSESSPAPCCQESCRIAAERTSSSDFDDVRHPPAPAHGEPAPTSTLRRLITPLINTLRRAKIR